MQTEVLQFELVAPNTWFPVLGTLTNFNTLGTFPSDKDRRNHLFDTQVPDRRTTIQVTKISIGKSFTKDEFEPGPNDVIQEPKKATPK